ncbi:hypothetical protein HK105_200275 [Polyrhizophydium stewartii]|uniref:DUF3421 domain-containing protein n=1 Tax=Polyrhizophydium stewartii TaxID=2732419 RepID=A0ABR4NL04_9FUNG
MKQRGGYGHGAPKAPRVDIGWEPCSMGHVPEFAVVGGQEKDGELFVGRVFDLLVLEIDIVADVAWGGKEVMMPSYEVLVADDAHLEWVAVRNNNISLRDEYSPIIGGREADGKELYIGRYHRDGNWVPGKVGDHVGGIAYSFGGNEHIARDFEVLCYHQW